MSISGTTTLSHANAEAALASSLPGEDITRVRYLACVAKLLFASSADPKAFGARFEQLTGLKMWIFGIHKKKAKAVYAIGGDPRYGDRLCLIVKGGRLTMGVPSVVIGSAAIEGLVRFQKRADEQAAVEKLAA